MIIASVCGRACRDGNFHMGSETPCAKTTISVRTSKGESVWVTLTAFDPLMNRLMHVRKGCWVSAQGRLKVSPYTDEEGNTRVSYELLVQSMDITHWSERRAEDVAEYGFADNFVLKDGYLTF